MAWDFTTEPEYQKKLDWADQFVRENVEPLDLLYPKLAFSPLEEPLKGLVNQLKDEVRGQDLWAAHLEPELGGKGYGQLKLALLNEILGRSGWAPIVFGCASARHRQCRDHRRLRHAAAEGAIPPAAAGGRVLLVATR